MVSLPLILAFYLMHHFKLGWRLWWIGAATFVLSQAGHIPFNIGVGYLLRNLMVGLTQPWTLIIQAVFLGLSAGLWEEMARYAAYRWWAREARSWPKGVLMGAGHGGIESMLLGLLVLITFFQMFAMQGLDPLALPVEQRQLVQQQMAAYWSAPWYATLLGAVERVFAMAHQILFSVLVLQVFVRRQNRWLWLAVAWHALIDAVAVYSVATWGPYLTEALLAVETVFAVLVIFALRQPETPQPEAPAPSPSTHPLNGNSLPVIEETLENIEGTRFD